MDKTFIFISLALLLSCRKDPVLTPQKPTITKEKEEFKFDYSGEWTYSSEYTIQIDTQGGMGQFRDTIIYSIGEDTLLYRYTKLASNYPYSTPPILFSELLQHKYYKLFTNEVSYTYDLSGNYILQSQHSKLRGFIRYDSLENSTYITYGDNPNRPMFSVPDEHEALLLNYNLTINDTLPWSKWNGGYGNPFYVYEIQKEDGYPYELINYEIRHNPNYHYANIISGIGSLSGFENDYGKLIKYTCNQFEYIP